ncbi:MAG: S-layer homology domain-containing protein [Clostridiales bacterium]
MKKTGLLLTMIFLLTMVFTMSGGILANENGLTVANATSQSPTLNSGDNQGASGTFGENTVVSSEPAANNGAINISFEVQKEYKFIIPQKTLSVVPGLAKTYGYEYGENVKPNDVTALDALVAAHINYYGDKFTPKNAGDYLVVKENGIIKMFNITTTAVGLLVNGAAPHNGVLSGGYYGGYGINQAVIKAENQVELFFYQDKTWGDIYTWFEQNGKKTQAVVVDENKPFTLTLRGYAYAWYNCSADDVREKNTKNIGGAQIAAVNTKDGSLTNIKGAVTHGENGNVELTFAQAGTYVISARGASPDYLVAPRCLVTVVKDATPVIDIKNMKDVFSTDWYYDDVEFVLAQGLFKGTSESTFGPQEPMTRAQFVTTLGRNNGVVDSTPQNLGNCKFSDVDNGAYYGSQIAWAVEKGITKGINATDFCPNKTISRQDMATMMMRYATAMGIKLPPPSTALFDDNSNITEYAKEAVYTMKAANIIKGKTDNVFDANGFTLRGEVAAVLHRFVKLGTSGGSDQSANSTIYENQKANSSILVTMDTGEHGVK